MLRVRLPWCKSCDKLQHHLLHCHGATPLLSRLVITLFQCTREVGLRLDATWCMQACQLPAAHTAYRKSVNIMAPLKLPWCFLHLASMVKTGILPHAFFSATEGIDLSSAEWRFTSGRLFAHESYSCRSSCFGSLIWAVAAFPPLLAYAVVQQLLNSPRWPRQQQERLFSNSRKS